jgi:hypothetical protein
MNPSDGSKTPVVVASIDELFRSLRVSKVKTPILRSSDGEKVATTCEQGGHRVGCERSACECSPPPGLSLDDSLWLGR